MLFSVSSVRRAAVVLAVGCATALTATAASAAPTGPAHSARPTVIPTCARANVRFHLSQGSGGAGTFTYLLRFTNTSHRTCYLFGFPGVAAVNRHGRQLGSPAAWASGAPLRVVTLRRGWTAHAVLAIANAAFFPHRLCPRAGSRSAGHPAEPGGARFCPAALPGLFPPGHDLHAGPADPAGPRPPLRPDPPGPRRAVRVRAGGPGWSPGRPPDGTLSAWQTR